MSLGCIAQYLGYPGINYAALCRLSCFSFFLSFFLSFSTLPPVNIFPLGTVSSLPFDAFLCRIEYGREGHNNTNSHRSGLLMIILLNAVQQHCSIRKKKKKKKKNDNRMKPRKTAGRRSTSGGGNRRGKGSHPRPSGPANVIMIYCESPCVDAPPIPPASASATTAGPATSSI